MAKNSVSDWDVVAANNTDVGGVDLAENSMRPRDVNNAIRTVMAQIKTTGWRREVLSASRTYYVRTDGSNSNNGLTNTSGGAFLTVQKAFDVIATIDLGGFDVTISVASGSYGTTTTTISSGWVGGNVAVTLNSGVTVGGFAVTNIGGILTFNGAGKIQPATNTACIEMLCAGLVRFGSIELGSSGTQNQLSVQHPGARLEANGNYSISAGAAAHVIARYGGLFFGAGRTVTITGTPAFAGAFIVCNYGAVVQASSMTFSGSATGKRYSVDSNSVVNTSGGGASYFPGDVAGTSATGGQYI